MRAGRHGRCLRPVSHPVVVLIAAAGLGACVVGCGGTRIEFREDGLLGLLFEEHEGTGAAARLALDPQNPDNRYEGTMQLARQRFGGEPAFLAHYHRCLEDEDAGVRYAGVYALGRHGLPEHAPAVAALLDDVDLDVQLEAARALQRLHDPAVVGPLIAAVLDTTPAAEAVRMEAAIALGQYPEGRVLDVLIQALDRPELALNLAARRSLVVLTGQDFGLSSAAWFGWIQGSAEPFAPSPGYTSPAFHRDRRILEYLPFTSEPPLEPPMPAVGQPRG